MISPSLLPPLSTKKHPAAAGCFRHSLWGLFHFLQVRQGDAVQVLVDHLVQPLPQGEGPAVASLFTALLLPRRQETEAKLPSASRRISPAA